MTVKIRWQSPKPSIKIKFKQAPSSQSLILKFKENTFLQVTHLYQGNQYFLLILLDPEMKIINIKNNKYKKKKKKKKNSL